MTSLPIMTSQHLVWKIKLLQDMLLSFQQDLNLTESELKRANEENRRLRQVLAA